MFKKKPDTPPAYSPHDLLPVSLRAPLRPPLRGPLRAHLSSLLFKSIKNKPYEPTPELQRQIDILGSQPSISQVSSQPTSSTPSISAVTSPLRLPSDLSTVSSNTQTEYFDVLPSFQMFQSILRRDGSQFSENRRGRPPVYGDQNTLPSPPPRSPALSPMRSRETDPFDAMHSNNDTEVPHEALYNGEAPPDDASHHNDNVAVTVDLSLHSPLDNIDKLAKAPSSPIDVQIHVTKHVPQPGTRAEMETRLKEYTSDDMVNGYITITNTGSVPVEFGLFTVSLEGTVKITERATTGSIMGPKFKKIIMKKFLKMYDLNALYGYTHVPNSSGIDYVLFTRDTDGCILGLPDDRVLQPKERYKKFFTFRFPKKLLDNACAHGLMPHLFPPPSFGLDRTCFGNRGEGVQLNKALGYGFLNARGTPLLTKDYAPDNTSVSYTIEAKFIDKLADEHVRLLEHDVNHSPDDEFVILRSAQYYLRFIPNLSEKMKFYNSMFELALQWGIAFFYIRAITCKSTLTQIDSMMGDVEEEIQEKFAPRELGSEKEKGTEVARGYAKKNKTRHEIDSTNSKSMLAGRTVPVYGKKKKAILLSLVRIGSLKAWARVPDHVMRYALPKLLAKYNRGDDGGDDGNALRPVTLNVAELYDHEDLELVGLSLEFEAADGRTRPPIISSIDVNVVVWSFHSEYAIPFEVGPDLFYVASEGTDALDDDDELATTRKNLQWVKDRAYHYLSFVKSTQTLLLKQAFLFLKAMKHLAVKKDTLREYFAPVTSTLHPTIVGGEGWLCAQHERGFRWTREIEVPLKVLNKNNVNLLPSFQSCLVGRQYCLQVMVKYKGGSSENGDFGDNVVRVEVPVMIG